MSSEEYLPVSMIKEYHFCPRVVYFSMVLGAGERRTESMAEGRESHERFHRLERRRTTVMGLRREKVLEKWSGLMLASERLGLVGVVDLVVRTEGGLKVVEFKEAKAPKKPPKSHLYQVAAYAMLVEEGFGSPVREVMIYYSKDRKLFSFPMTDELREHVIWTVKRIRRIVEEGVLPRPQSTRKCRSCGYYWICKGV